MKLLDAKVGGRSVIWSGTLVAGKGDEIEIYPFPEFPSQRVLITIDFDDNIVGSRTDIKTINDQTVELAWAGSWMQAHAGTSSSWLQFASTPTEAFYLRRTINLIGLPESYTVIISMTIASEQK